jgi:hypothetical protein
MEKYPKVSVQARSSNKEVKYGKRQVQALFRWLDKDHLQLCHGDLWSIGSSLKIDKRLFHLGYQLETINIESMDIHD